MNQRNERIADIGCGPADILRFIDPMLKPEYYLGIDISEDYISQAAKKAEQLQMRADFMTLDLEKLPHSDFVQGQLTTLLEQKKISTVLLLGVIHHIDDEAVSLIMNLFGQIKSIKRVITQDVLSIPGNHINNFYASLDRGMYIRDEPALDLLIKKFEWGKIEKVWTNPGINSIKYIHYKLSK
jgi:SAM-dependent methyltransferase